MKSSSGLAFTLIELLIVVAIIAILAAIALPNFFAAQVRAKVARAQSDQRTLEHAFDSYLIDYGSYPPTQATSADNYEGYRYLTTPVAYLPMALVDPFGLPYVQNRANDYDTRYEFMCTRLPDRTNQTREGINNLFNIQSVGPDGRDSFKPTQAYPSHPPEFEFYDPSNGLYSWGDILRAGGNYLPRWYRERQGGRRTTGNNWI